MNPGQCVDIHTLDLSIVALGLPHKQSCSFSIEWVGRIWVSKELWEEDLEDIDHIEHRRPSLVDDIKTDRTRSNGPSVIIPLYLKERTTRRCLGGRFD